MIRSVDLNLDLSLAPQNESCSLARDFRWMDEQTFVYTCINTALWLKRKCKLIIKIILVDIFSSFLYLYYN